MREDVRAVAHGLPPHANPGARRLPAHAPPAVCRQADWSAACPEAAYMASGLAKDVGSLHEYAALADVLLVAAHGTELPAHSQVLARHSALVRALLAAQQRGAAPGACPPHDGDAAGTGADGGAPPPRGAAPLRIEGALREAPPQAVATALRCVYSDALLSGVLREHLRQQGRIDDVMAVAAALEMPTLLQAGGGRRGEERRGGGGSAAVARACGDFLALSPRLVGADPLRWLLVAERHSLATLQTRALEQLALQLASRPDDAAAALALDPRWHAVGAHTTLLLANALACGLRATARAVGPPPPSNGGGGGGAADAALARVRLGPRTLLLGEALEEEGELPPQQAEELRKAIGLRVPVVLGKR
eukprot:scaffold2.g6912.t1